MTHPMYALCYEIYDIIEKKHEKLLVEFPTEHLAIQNICGIKAVMNLSHVSKLFLVFIFGI